jgi:RNA polymerase sigma factor (sigma-70 family)
MPKFLAKLGSKYNRLIIGLLRTLGRRRPTDFLARHARRRRRDRDQIADRLARLSPMVREVFLLRVVEQMSIAEVAHRLAISRDEAKRHLRRAIRGLMR